MTAVPQRDAPDVVDWGDARGSRPGRPWVVALLTTLAITGLVVGRIGEPDRSTEINLSAVLVGAVGSGSDAPTVVRIRVVNEGPVPVTVRLFGVAVPGLVPQAVAASDRVEPLDGRDITVPLRMYDCGRLAEATLYVEVHTADQTRMLSLPLQNPRGLCSAVGSSR